MLDQLWKKVHDHFAATFTQQTFDLWFAPIKPKTLVDGLLSVEVPNHYHAVWLEKNAKKKIIDILKTASTDVLDAEFVWDESKVSQNRLDVFIKNQITKNDSRLLCAKNIAAFNPKYSFERFVVGPTNRFAQASGLAVAQNPGKQFNPLFIYGNSGLGKTHLLHAIGSATLKNNPRIHVLYVTSEKFINDFIDSIKNKTMESFRSTYRGVDCLLIDDVQFLAGKEQSEQEFFFTFNALFETNRQLVLTSDRPPKELPTIEARLISRFEWGVVADIKPPDFETRLAILRKKAELEGVLIPDNILQYIAQNIRSNIRTLEGCLNGLIAYSCLTGSSVDMETTSQILNQVKEEFIQELSSFITISRIQEVVAKNYHVDAQDLKDKSRMASKVLPRQVAMYLARTLTKRSLHEIGVAFGGKDHSTIVHAVSKVATLIRTDPFFASFVNKLEKEIKSSVDI